MPTSRKTFGKFRDLSEDASSDARLLSNFFIQNESELLGTLFFLLGTLDDARRALDDVFAALLKLDRPENVKDLRAWVFRVLLTIARENARTDWLRRKKETEWNTLDDVANETERELIQSARASLSRLTPAERSVFLLRVNGGLSYQRIAQAIGATLAQTHETMREALRKLSIDFDATTRESGLKPSEIDNSGSSGTEKDGLSKNDQRNA